MTLKDCLERCLVIELRAMARRQDLRLQSLLKRDIISQLDDKIPASVSARRYETDLSEAARCALAFILDAGGLMGPSEIQARYGELRAVLPGGIESCQPWGDGHCTPLDELHAWGLLFRVPADGGDVMRIPTDLRERLRPAAAARPRVFRACAAPTSPAGRAPFLCQDTMLLVSALQENPAPKLVSGGIARRELLRLNSHLLAPDEISESRTERSARRFHFLRCLTNEMQLITAQGSRFEPGPNMEKWLALTPAARSVHAMEAYASTTEWSEWDIVTTVQWASPPAAEVVLLARRFLMRLLSEAEPDEWQSLTSLIQAARTRNSFLLRRPGDNCVARCPESGRDLTAKDWPTVEGAWIEAAIRGPLFWLGLVEPGRTRRGEVSAFRVPASSIPFLAAGGQRVPEESEAGRHSATPSLVGSVPDGISNLAGAPILAPDETETEDRNILSFENENVILVGCDIDLGRWFRLERFCDLIERGPVSRYRVSREKVRQRLQAGLSHEAILADLGPDVPESLALTIANWCDRFGQVRVFSARLLTVSEPAMMAELRSIPEINACLGQSFGSRACVILPHTEQQIAEILRSRGEMPRMESSGQADLGPQEWSEIQQALACWKKHAAANGAAGPSDKTCALVDGIVDTLAGVSSGSGALPQPLSEQSEKLALLEDAIRRKLTVHFDYKPPERDTPVKVAVLAKGLGQQKGVTHLCGFRKGGSAIDRFRIDCITSIEPLPQSTH